MLAVALFSFCVNLLSLAVPIYLLQLYDRVIPNRSTDTLVLLTIIMVVALVTNAGLDAVRGVLLARVGEWLHRSLSGPVLSATIQRALRKGRPSVQGLRDLSSVRHFVAGHDFLTLFDTPWSPVFIFVLFLLHPWIGTLVLIGTVALLFLAYTNELMSRGPSKLAADASVKALDEANAVVRHAEVISAMGMRHNLISSWCEKNEDALALQTRLAMRNRWSASLAKFVRLSLQISVMGLAAWLILQNQLTAGALIASVLLMRRAVAPMERSISSWKSVLSARNAMARINDELGRASREVRSRPAPSGDLSVSGLRFYHPNASTPILRSTSFQLLPGEAIGLVGSTGAGKSTLARLLVGNAVPYRGHVQIGGVDVSSWDAEELGPHLGYLPQDVALFEGTVAENIARMGEVDEEAAIEAAKRADVHQLISGLAEGYNTPIGEDGVLLSGGQRQRIALARAVYGSPKLIVLDEPDAHLDRDGRKALSKAIAELKHRGAMVVLITHQIRIPDHIDRILVLRKGRVEPVIQEVEASRDRQARHTTSSIEVPNA
jgi:PrtD family type I secretion system ABC transporter